MEDFHTKSTSPALQLPRHVLGRRLADSLIVLAKTLNRKKTIWGLGRREGEKGRNGSLPRFQDEIQGSVNGSFKSSNLEHFKL
jgi:hypothetical protein